MVEVGMGFFMIFKASTHQEIVEKITYVMIKTAIISMASQGCA